MESGVHKCARQLLRSLTFFPAAGSMEVIDEEPAEILHQGEEGVPIVKFMFKDLVPEVLGA